jgi:hypothetical protein
VGAAEGQGTVDVRANGIYEAVENVGIGDVYMVAGQSNASGRLTNNQSYSHATLKAAMLANDLTWKELVDPIDDNTNQVYAVTEDTAVTGSPWPLLATSIMADQSVPVAFIPVAKGGTRISQHEPGGDHSNTNTIYGVVNTEAQLNASGVKAVLWWQGESDVTLGTSEAEYNTALDNIADSYVADFSAPLVASNQAVPPVGQDNTAVNNAIATAIGDNANVLQGPDISDLTPSAPLHFKTDGEAATIAGRWWTALEALFYT